MMKLLSMILVLLAALTQGDADQLFYRAFYLESALRQMDQAAEKYAEAAVAAKQAGNADLELKSVLGRARCLQATGRQEEARALYQQALKLDPNSEEAVAALAEKDPAEGIDPELAAQIRVLVEDLGVSNRTAAVPDLMRIGRLALPYLEEGLRSREALVVEQAARLLAQVGGMQSISALERALGDKEVLFPRLVAGSASGWRVDEQTETLFKVALTHPDVETRRATAKNLRYAQDFSSEVMARLVAIALDDPDPAVRAEILGNRQIDWSPFVQTLRTILSSESSSVRLAATQQVASNPRLSQELASSLNLLLQDKEPEIRRAAAKGMMNFEPAAANAAAMQLLSDSDPLVEAVGIEILTESPLPWGDEVREAVCAFFRAELSRSAGGNSTRRLRELLHARNRGLLGEDLVALLRCTDAALPSDVISGLRSEIVAQLYQLTNARPDQWWQLIKSAFQESTTVQGQLGLLDFIRQVVQVGGAPFGEGPISLYVVAARSGFPAVRLLTYKQLFQHVRQDVVVSLPHLLSDLGGEDVDLAAAAFYVAMDYPWKEAARPALALLRRPGFRAGGNAPRLLDFYAKSAGEDAVPELRRVLGEGDRDLRDKAITCLAQVVGIGALPDLLRLAERDGDAATIAKQIPNGELLDSFVQRLPAERIDADLLKFVVDRVPGPVLEKLLTQALGSEDQETVIEACKLADLAAFDSLLPKLTALLESDAYLVRNQAGAAVESIQKRRYQRTTAALFGPAGRSEAIERAMRLLKSEDPIDRQGGALALGALGDVAAVPALMDLLEDSDLAVRKAAVQALENLGRSKETPQSPK
ncbi:MAG: HEAT repeat domain-containing protein [Planctomycetota bacterium]